MLAPAASMALARVTTSSQAMPPSSMSMAAMRKMTMKSLGTASRTRRTTSTGKRMRFSKGPPHWSVRRLVFSTRKVDRR